MNTYKYLQPERISFLTDGLLRCTQPDALNDPLECLPVLSIEDTRQVLETVFSEQEAAILDDILNEGLPRRADWEFLQQRKAELKSNPGKFRDLFFQQARQKLNASIGVLCLSKRWDSGLMWAHYAASHTGFCVGFHRNHPFFRGDGQQQPGLREVRYSEQRIKVSLERGRAIDIDVMFTKSPDWQYEQEERMLFELKDATKVLDTIPYKIHLFQVPTDAISEVIIGSRADNPVAEQVLKFCLAHGLNAFRAQFSDSGVEMLRVAA